LSKKLTQEYLKSRKIKLTDACKDISKYIGVEYEKQFYHRVHAYLNGTGHLTDEELEGINAYMTVVEDPHDSGVYAYKMRQVKFSVLERYMASGIYNATIVRNMFKHIKSIK